MSDGFYIRNSKTGQEEPLEIPALSRLVVNLGDVRLALTVHRGCLRVGTMGEDGLRDYVSVQGVAQNVVILRPTGYLPEIDPVWKDEDA